MSGARAQFKGLGAINGEDNYSFMLTAIDSQVNGGSDPDRVRMRIWHTETECLIYDNRRGTSDTSALGDANGNPSWQHRNSQVIDLVREADVAKALRGAYVYLSGSF